MHHCDLRNTHPSHPKAIHVGCPAHSRQPPGSTMMHARAVGLQRRDVLRREIPLVQLPGITRHLGRECDHHRVALDLGQHAGRRNRWAAHVRLDDCPDRDTGSTGSSAEPILTKAQQPDPGRVGLLGLCEDGLGAAPCAPCVPVRTIVKADMCCSSVAAASVLAKVERDAMMVALAAEVPGYAWELNKGYFAPEHLVALQCHGPS